MALAAHPNASAPASAPIAATEVVRTRSATRARVTARVSAGETGRGKVRALPRPGDEVASAALFGGWRGDRVAEGTRLLSGRGAKTPPRVRIPPSPLARA